MIHGEKELQKKKRSSSKSCQAISVYIPEISVRAENNPYIHFFSVYRDIYCADRNFLETYPDSL